MKYEDREKSPFARLWSILKFTETGIANIPQKAEIKPYFVGFCHHKSSSTILFGLFCSNIILPANYFSNTNYVFLNHPILRHITRCR